MHLEGRNISIHLRHPEGSVYHSCPLSTRGGESEYTLMDPMVIVGTDCTLCLPIIYCSCIHKESYRLKVELLIYLRVEDSKVRLRNRL